MKMLKNVVVTSVLVVPMILSAQIVVQGMGIRLTIQMVLLQHNIVIKQIINDKKYFLYW